MNTQDLSAIRTGFRKVLMAHVKEPFLTLREAGLSAQIALEIKMCLVQSYVSYSLEQTSRNTAQFKYGAIGKVDRVQLEMKVPLVHSGRSLKIFDIVVLVKTGPVVLKCHGGGPGDVVAQLQMKDIAAGIEVKASPSYLWGQRNLYVKDIDALTALSNQGKCGFFVLADKSLELYGKWVNKPDCQAWIDRIKSDGWEVQQRRINSSAPADGWVEVWDLVRRNGLWKTRLHHVRRRVI